MDDADLERDLLGSSGSEAGDRSAGRSSSRTGPSKSSNKRAKAELTPTVSKRQRMRMEFLDTHEMGGLEDGDGVDGGGAAGDLDDELAMMGGDGDPRPAQLALGGEDDRNKVSKRVKLRPTPGDGPHGSVTPTEGPQSKKKSTNYKNPGPAQMNDSSDRTLIALPPRPSTHRVISGFSSSSEIGDSAADASAGTTETSQALTRGHRPTALHANPTQLSPSMTLPTPPPRSGSSGIEQGVSDRHDRDLLGPASGSGSLETPDAVTDSHSQPSEAGGVLGSTSKGTGLIAPDRGETPGTSSGAAQDRAGAGHPIATSVAVGPDRKEHALDGLASPRIGGLNGPTSGTDLAGGEGGSASPAPLALESNGIVTAAIVRKKKPTGSKPDRARPKVGVGADGSVPGGSGDAEGNAAAPGSGSGKGKGKAKTSKLSGMTTDDLVKMSMDVHTKPTSPATSGPGPGKAWRKGLKKGMTRADLPLDHPYHPSNLIKPAPPTQSYLNPNPNFNIKMNGSFDSGSPDQPPGPSRTGSQEILKKKGGWPKGRPRAKGSNKGLLGLDPEQLAKMSTGLGIRNIEGYNSQHAGQSRGGSTDPEDLALDDGDASSAADGMDRFTGSGQLHYGHSRSSHAGQRPQRPIRYDIDPYAPVNVAGLAMPLYTSHIPSKGIPIYKIPPTLKGREKELAVARPVREQLGPRPREWVLGTRVILGVGGAHLKLKSWLSFSESPFEQARKAAAAHAAQLQYEDQSYGTYVSAFGQYPIPDANVHYQHSSDSPAIRVDNEIHAQSVSPGRISDLHPRRDEGTSDMPTNYAAAVAPDIRLESAAQDFLEEADAEEDDEEDASEPGGTSGSEDVDDNDLPEDDDMDLDEAMQELL